MMASVLRDKKALVLLCCFVVAVGLTLIPNQAEAAGGLAFLIQDKVPHESVQDDLLAKAAQFINGISVSGLTETFRNLLGDSFTTVKRVFEQVSKGFGYAVLVIVYLVQLVKIATHMEGNATLPGVKETVFLLIFFVIFKHIVDCSLDYIEYIYNEFNRLTIWIGNSGGLSTNQAGEFALTGNLVTEAQIQGLLNEDDSGFVQLIEALVIFISAFVLQFAAFFSVLARSLQAYVLAIFSPIPVAFLGLDDTRSWGVGYLKNFIAICMAGCLIMVIVLIIPHVLAAAARSGGFIAVTASCFVGVFAMFKAGGWAREILGG